MAQIIDATNYTYFFEHHPEAVLVTDYLGCVHYANRSAEKLFDHPKGQMIGSNFREWLRTEDSRTLEYYYQKALFGQTHRFEVSCSLVPPAARMLQVKTVPNEMDDTVRRVTFYLEDISDKKRQEADDQETARELCESFIEHNRDPILLLDTKAVIVLANRAFSELLGWRKDNLEGFHILQCPSIPPPLVQQMKDYFHKVVDYYSGGNGMERELSFLETIRVTDSGMEYQMMLSITPIYKRGEICNWAVHLRNVTDKFSLQKELKQLSMKQEVSSEINKLEHLNTVSQLAASISHEVRNPLTVSRGFIQLLNTPGLADAKKTEYIKLCLSELDRAEAIISDYLTFAKPILDDVHLLDLYEELDYIEKVMVPFATIKNVEYVYRRNDIERLYFCGNAKKFQQAIINLIKNGIEAMEGGGAIRIDASLEANNKAVIRIADNGIGMDAEELHRLGKPFYTTKEQGTGLGTMVAFSIIESMQGEIEVESKAGEGTCFSIYLPVKNRPAARG